MSVVDDLFTKRHVTAFLGSDGTIVVGLRRVRLERLACGSDQTHDAEVHLSEAEALHLYHQLGHALNEFYVEEISRKGSNDEETPF